MGPRTLERAPGLGVPPNVISWLETQPGGGAPLLANRAIRNHLGRYTPEAWPEVRALQSTSSENYIHVKYGLIGCSVSCEGDEAHFAVRYCRAPRRLWRQGLGHRRV